MIMLSLYIFDKEVSSVWFAFLLFYILLHLNLVLFCELSIMAPVAGGKYSKAHTTDEEVDAHHVLNPGSIVSGV